MIVGIFMYGLIIGSLTSLLGSLNLNKQEQKRKLDAVRRYLGVSG